MSLFELILISSIFCCLLTITIFDYKHQWIPDELNGLLIILSLVLVLPNEVQTISSVYGILFGYGGIYLIRLFFLQIRKVEVIGLGDAKLLAGIGAWFGAFSISYIVFMASLFGIVAYIFHRQRQSAFGPYLCLSAYTFFWYQIL
ncbi:A24 family peptidase [Marinomonas algicola]|uniref:prepilin peptidase n=1 Tax=Marinomonas algicola TaxID=2773454 RepID=UPI001EFF061A|nr:A24 family peptidase [Marinomonas algicola]